MIFATFVISTAVSATVNIDIDLPQNTFYDEDQLKFDYTLTSTQEENITFTPYMLCPNNQIPLLEEINILLEEDVPYSAEYKDFIVDEQYSNSATCSAGIKITDPFEQESHETFNIDVLPKMATRLSFNSQLCEIPQVFFTSDETVTANIRAENQMSPGTPLETQNTGFYVNPEGENVEIDFSGDQANIPFDGYGNYYVEITSSLGGYMDKTENKYFSYLEEHIPIILETNCNSNSICENNENYQNCPMDCYGIPGDRILRNEPQYDENMVFLATDNDWRNILRLVPVVSWNIGMTHKNYPMLILHNEGLTLQEENYALARNGATITANNYHEEQNSPDAAIDGELSSRWNSGTSEESWLEVDMGSSKIIDQIKLYHFGSVDYYANIEVKETPEDEWQLVEENIELLGHWLPIVVDFDPVTARYVRITMDTLGSPDWKTLNEIEIFNTQQDPCLKEAFDPDSIITFLQQYEPSRVFIFGDTPQEFDDLLTADEPFGAGLDETQLRRQTPYDVFSYWNEFDKVVIVDYDDYKAALLGSTIASKLNSPILFIDRLNIDLHQYVINGREAIVVGDVDSETRNGIDDWASQRTYLTIEQAQNHYKNLMNPDKILMVNPHDWNYAFVPENKFLPEKTDNKLLYTFTKDSVTAPFLAAAKNELLMFNEIPKSPLNNECSSNYYVTENIQTTDQNMVDFVNRFQDNDFEYLTIISNHYSIPESQFSYCYNDDTEGGKYQVRIQQDKKYARHPNNEPIITQPVIDRDSQNNIYAVWHQASEIFYKKTDQDMNTLIEDTQLTDDDNHASFSPDTAIDSYDHLNVVWSDLRDVATLEIYFNKIDQNGYKVFAQDKKISPDNSIDKYEPKIISDENYLYVFWRVMLPGNQFYKMQKLNYDGSKVGEVMEIGESFNVVGDYDLAIDDNYIYLISSKSISENGKQIVFLKLDKEGNLIKEEIIEETDYQSLDPQVVMDSDENLHIIWRDYVGDSKSELFYKKIDKSNNELIAKKEIETTNKIKQLHHLSLAINSQDKLFLTLREVINALDDVTIIKLDKYGNEIKRMHVNSQAGSIKDTDILIDDSEDVYVVWQWFQGNERINFIKLDSNLQQVIENSRLNQYAENFHLSVGRVYGITPTDTSTVVARSIMYDKMTDKLYNENEYNTLWITRSFSHHAIKASTDSAIMDKSKVNAVCSTDEYYGCEHIDDHGKIPDEYLEDKQIILLTDHGGISNFGAGSILTHTMPYVQNPFVFGYACSTNNVWQGYHPEGYLADPGINTFGLHFLRNGAVSYIGSAGLTFDSRKSSDQFIKLMTQGNQRTIGDANEIADTDLYYRQHFVLIGDPTLSIKSKRVNWEKNVILPLEPKKKVWELDDPWPPQDDKVKKAVRIN